MKTTLDIVNTSRVLRAIWLNGPISRVELANLLDLDKSTVTKIVATLSETGIIEPVAEGKAGPRGGRRPIYLTVRPAYGCILGLEIRTDAYLVSLVDLSGEVLSTRVGQVRFAGRELSELFVAILTAERELIESTGMPLLGIGLGVSGLVNPMEGIIYQSIPLSIIRPTNFFDEAAKRLHIPVKIDNDANCCCWGELTAHAEDRPQNLLFVLGELRTEFREPDSEEPGFTTFAVGFGLVVDGKVRSGSDYSAGEFRSILWQPRSTSQFSVGDEEISQISDHKVVRQKVLRELAKHIAFLVNTLDLNHVVIGGTIEDFSKELLPLVEEEIKQNWHYAQQVCFSARTSARGSFSVSYGAAAMFLEKLFSLPDVTSGRQVDSTEGVGLLEQIQLLRAENRSVLR